MATGIGLICSEDRTIVAEVATAKTKFNLYLLCLNTPRKLCLSLYH